MHGSDLRVHGQMLTVALAAMFPRIAAHPEKLRPVRIETTRPLEHELHSPEIMLVEAQR